FTGHTNANQTAVPIDLQPIGEGDAPIGDDMELDTENLGQEEDLEDPELKDALANVADAVSSKLAMLDNPIFSDPNNLERGGKKGDLRRGGGGTGGTGKPRRWEIIFDKGNTLETYARQLDYFKIELGVLLPDNRVQYVSNLSSSRPTVRTGPADQEKRYYLTWRQGDLMQADLELLAKAGVQASGKIILKFLPPEVERRLYELEQARAGNRADRVLRTRFGIRPQGGGFDFFVIDQSYR
ncbi:MAG: hypothetical protein D6741_06395, partial [Planctomycetota bacterium]